MRRAHCMCRRCCAAVPAGAGVCQDRPGCGVHAYPTQPRQPCPPHPATTRAGTRRQHHARHPRARRPRAAAAVQRCRRAPAAPKNAGEAAHRRQLPQLPQPPGLGGTGQGVAHARVPPNVNSPARPTQPQRAPARAGSFRRRRRPAGVRWTHLRHSMLQPRFGQLLHRLSVQLRLRLRLRAPWWTQRGRCLHARARALRVHTPCLSRTCRPKFSRA